MQAVPVSHGHIYIVCSLTCSLLLFTVGCVLVPTERGGTVEGAGWRGGGWRGGGAAGEAGCGVAADTGGWEGGDLGVYHFMMRGFPLNVELFLAT